MKSSKESIKFDIVFITLKIILLDLSIFSFDIEDYRAEFSCFHEKLCYYHR